MTPERLIFASVAQRLAAGTYQPRAKAPSSPVTELPPSPWAIVAPYVGSALLGAFLAACFMVGNFITVSHAFMIETDDVELIARFCAALKRNPKLG